KARRESPSNSVAGLNAKRASGHSGAHRSLSIILQETQIAPSRAVPIKNPRTRKSKSLLPKPSPTQIRRTATKRIGNGSKTSEFRNSLRLGAVATYTLLTSSRQRGLV